MEIYDLASCNIASALLRCDLGTVLLMGAIATKQELAQGKYVTLEAMRAEGSF